MSLCVAKGNALINESCNVSFVSSSANSKNTILSRVSRLQLIANLLFFEKMKEDGTITTKQVMSFFEVKERKSQRALKELGDAGLATSYREGCKVVWQSSAKKSDGL